MDTAESQAKTLTEMQAEKDAKQATVASLLQGMAGEAGGQHVAVALDLPLCLADVRGMQVLTLTVGLPS